MRNLKRALSMALAAVMVLGLMVVGASATSYNDFTDKDEIVHKDAVAMVTELGVLAGLPDGSFGGTQNIDRASFARLVCVVLNGGKEPVLGELSTTFTDTQGNWAESYIAFCVDRGIIAGRGDGTFGPSDNVTGSEAAKMLLVALGYNTAYEGIGGSTWEITTNTLANMAGLYEDLETINPSAPLTRDDAAQMIYNVLNANVVSYSFSFNADGSTTAVQNKSSKTMLEDKFGVVIVEGVVTANEFADITADDSSLKEGKTAVLVSNYEVGQNNYGNAAGTKTETFNVSSGKDVLGRSVILYVKPSATASNSADKATVIGSVVASSTNTVVTDAGRDNLYDVASDNKLTLSSTTTLIAQNYDTAAADPDLIAKDATNATRGEVRTLIDNDNDSKVDYVLIETYALGKVTSYSTSDDGSITLNGTSSLSYDDAADVVGFDDVAKGDYVLYAEIGGKLYVEKAESVTGELTAYKNSGATSTLTVDGTKYNVSGLAFYNDGNKLSDPKTYDTLDKDATFYLDGQGNIIAVDGTASSNNYAFLIASATVGGVDQSVEVKVALDDGTTAVYTLDEDNSDVNSGDKNTLCTYTISDDNEIALTKVTATETSEANLVIKKGAATVGGISGAYADSSTVFFFVSPDGTYTASGNTFSQLSVDEVSVYAGKDNVPSLTTNTDILYYADGSDIKAVVVVTDSVGSSSSYIYLYQYLGRNSNGYLYNAIVDGEIVENVTVTNVTGATGLYNYSLTTSGNYKTSSATNTVSGNVTRIDGDSVIIGGVEYTLTSDTVIANIDGSSTALEAVINEGDYVTVKYNNSTDKELDAVFVTLPYDASKTEISVNADAATSADVTITISGDVVTVGGTNKTSVTGATLAGCFTCKDENAAVVVCEKADGTTDVDSNAIEAGDFVVVTYTDDNSNTLVDIYTIAIAD